MTEKLRKEFVDYIENLSDEAWRAGGLTDHMAKFAGTKGTTRNPVVEESADPVKVTLEELGQVKALANLETPGVFWDGDNGRFVTGPVEDDDEDMIDDISFNQRTYCVGEKTGRVYENQDGKDFFVGFKGIGPFKKLKV
jgi:hypothetical protein